MSAREHQHNGHLQKQLEVKTTLSSERIWRLRSLKCDNCRYLPAVRTFSLLKVKCWFLTLVGRSDSRCYFTFLPTDIGICVFMKTRRRMT